MNARVHSTSRVRAVPGWACVLGLGWTLALAPARGHAQLAEQTELRTKEELAKDQDEHRMLEQRRRTGALGGHNFVAPLSLRSVPFEFAIPLAQLASHTQVALAWVSGDRNVEQGPSTTHYALLTQIYDLSVRFGERAELSVSPIGEVAAGLDPSSIASGGAAAAVGGSAAFAYRLVPFERVAVTLRGSMHMEKGYRANIEPLLYQVGTNPVSLVKGLDGARIGTPTTEVGGALGLSMAWAFSPRVSAQGSLRLDGISTTLSPWLDRQGTEQAGPRELVYEAWNPSVGVAVGVYLGEVLLQPQLAVAYHRDTLASPNQDRGPYTRGTYLVPALQAMFLASPILQLGGGVGCELAWTQLQDNYKNQYSTSMISPFVQLVARYIWGQSWPGT
jgi:hypothetical protein